MNLGKYERILKVVIHILIFEIAHIRNKPFSQNIKSSLICTCLIVSGYPSKLYLTWMRMSV